MSYQMPPTGGPPRNTPIPGQSTPIPGTGPSSAFHGVPTPGVFLGTHDTDGPPPLKPKKSRNYGFWIVAAIIFISAFGGIAVAVWGFFTAKDAVDTANDKINEISIPEFPDFTTPDGSGNGDDGPAVNQLLDGGPAATAAALDAGIPGDPTNFIEILLYPEYSFGTAQDPVRPERIDRYQWRDGVLDAPDPQSNDPDAPSKVFTITEVQWDAISALAADAPRLASVEEGAVTHISITRDTVFSETHDIVVRIYLSGPRSNAFIEATADGTILRIV